MYSDYKKAKSLFRAIDHDLRKAIISVIANGQKNVTQIYTKLRLEQSVASMHLAILRRAGVVLVKRKGKEKYYSVRFSQIQFANKMADEITERLNRTPILNTVTIKP